MSDLVLTLLGKTHCCRNVLWSSPFFTRRKLGFKTSSVVVYQDWERLHAALGDMQTYWDMLERKRKQLEEEKEEDEEEQMVGSVVRTTLPQGIKHIQLDLQDLMGQVSSQVSSFSLLLPVSVSSTQQPQFLFPL